MSAVERRRIFAGMLAALLASSIFGIFHDLVTFALSPDYYLYFKFQQFGVSWAHTNPYGGVLCVGAMATWWFGLLVWCVLEAALHLWVPLHARPGVLKLALSTVFLIAVAGALAAGVVVWECLPLTFTEAHLGWLRAGVTDRHAFIRVGLIHGMSYGAGAFALVVGIVLVWWRCRYS